MKFNNLLSKLNYFFKNNNKSFKRYSFLFLGSVILLIFGFNLIFSFNLSLEKIKNSVDYAETIEVIDLKHEDLNSFDYKANELLISENATKRMYINLFDTNIIVEDKNTLERFETLKVSDGVSNFNESYQKTPLNVTYTSPYWGNATRDINAYDNSTKYYVDKNPNDEDKQELHYTVEKIKNGVRVIYNIGDFRIDVNELPEKLTVEKFEEIISKITNQDDSKFLKKMYYYSRKNNYYIRPPKPNYRDINRMYTLLYKIAKFTHDDLYEQNKIFGIETNVSSNVNFFIPVEYTLDGEDLLVKVPTSHIVENNDFKILSIDVLPYFGSTLINENGFMFIPDGSGAIINTNETRKDILYNKKVYHSDQFVDVNSYEPYRQEILMPLFGISSGEKAIFGIIEDGASQASINSRSAYLETDLYKIHSKIDLRSKDLVNIIDTTKVLVTSPRFDVGYEVRYKFLSKPNETISYMDMVNSYQEYLIDKHNLTEKNVKPNLVIEALGSVSVKKYFVGIPYDSMISLTSYNQMKEIMNDLGELENVNYIYKGWANGGIHHNMPSSLKLDSVLGSEKEWQSLQDQIQSNNVDFYHDLSFTTVYGNNENRFNNKSHGLNLIGTSAKPFYQYNYSTNKFDFTTEPYYYLSPNYLSSLVDRFIDIENYNLNGISLNDLGNTYYVDYGKKTVSPESATSIIESNLNKLNNQYQIVLNQPFVYAINYGDLAINMPTSSSNYLAFDYNIPFLQLVYNGLFEYSNESYNLGTNYNLNNQFLHSLETGSAMKFTISHENSSLLKNTEFNYYNSTEYSSYSSSIKEFYKEYEQVYSQLGNGRIKNHQTIKKDLVLVEFENGMYMYINYTDKNQIVNGYDISSNDYLLVNGGVR